MQSRGEGTFTRRSECRGVCNVSGHIHADRFSGFSLLTCIVGHAVLTHALTHRVTPQLRSPRPAGRPAALRGRSTFAKPHHTTDRGPLGPNPNLHDRSRVLPDARAPPRLRIHALTSTFPPP